MKFSFCHFQIWQLSHCWWRAVVNGHSGKLHFPFRDFAWWPRFLFFYKRKSCLLHCLKQPHFKNKNEVFSFFSGLYNKQKQRAYFFCSKPHMKSLGNYNITLAWIHLVHLPGSPKLNQQDSWVSSRGLGIALLLGPLGIASPTSGNAEIFIFETNPNSGRNDWSILIQYFIQT